MKNFTFTLLFNRSRHPSIDALLWFPIVGQQYRLSCHDKLFLSLFLENLCCAGTIPLCFRDWVQLTLFSYSWKHTNLLGIHCWDLTLPSIFTIQSKINLVYVFMIWKKVWPKSSKITDLEKLVCEISILFRVGFGLYRMGIVGLANDSRVERNWAYVIFFHSQPRRLSRNYFFPCPSGPGEVVNLIPLVSPFCRPMVIVPLLECLRIRTTRLLWR